MIVVLSNRPLRLDYGEDRLLRIAIDVLKKHGFEVALCILSKNVCIANKQRFDTGNVLDKCRYLVLHHDVSLTKTLLFLVDKVIHRDIETIHMIYFLDTYSPITLIRNVAGWFLAQLWNSYIATSRYVYKHLRKFLVIRGKYLPVWKLYRFHIPKQPYRRGGKTIRITYVGVVDTERLNVEDIARLVYKLRKAFGKSIELYVVARADQNVKEVDRWVRPWLRIVVIKRFLDDTEKRELLCRCHIATFTAKRIRFVVPPLFVVEARSCGCLVYAPYLANVLREEGLDNVYSSIDELVEALRKSMSK